MPLSKTMNELKDAINRSPKFGPLGRTHQRLFHLGRELKTGSRSLGNMGIGKFRNYTILLHVKPGAKNQTQNNNKKKSAGATSNNTNSKSKRKAPQASSNPKRKEDVVVDLLDSDDDDSEEIEVIENPAVPASKRQRQR